MRGELSKKIIWIINVVVTLIFVCGMSITIFYPQYVVIGIICQMLSFIYTVFCNIKNTMVNSSKFYCGTPSIYFTDRDLTLTSVLERLYLIINTKTHERMISIVCNEESGNGKTELLLKLYQILTEKNKGSIQNDEILQTIRKRIGVVHFIKNDDNNMGQSSIGHLNYILGKINIILLDNFNSNYRIKDDKFIIIYCEKNDVKYTMDNRELIKLNDFSRNDIREFYSKKYKDEIPEELLNRIMHYSNGNVTKISTVLESKESIEQFSNSDDILFSIITFINSGNYKCARELISKLTTKQLSSIQNNNDMNFEYEFILADLNHFENNYNSSLECFEILRTKNMQVSERIIRITERIAHMYKHLGKFSESLCELNDLPDLIKYNECLSVYALEYCTTHETKYILEANKILQIMSRNVSFYVSDEKNRYNTYLAVFSAYNNKFEVAHHNIDKAINQYSKNDSKFLNNCLFIKGEIFRREKKYVDACSQYQRCLRNCKFNNDFDEYSLAHIMMKFVILAYNVDCQFEETYTLLIIKQRTTELGMTYNLRLAMELDELLKAKEMGNIQRFDSIVKKHEEYIYILP